MKEKTSLSLMEQIIMLAVFALAAAICLRAFVWSDSASVQSADADRALLLSQNAAEYLRHTGGDLEEAARLGGGTAQGDCWIIDYEDGWVLTATPLHPNQRYFGAAEITVTDGSRTLSTLRVGYQEVSADG